jgi:hypothetical protein
MPVPCGGSGTPGHIMVPTPARLWDRLHRLRFCPQPSRHGKVVGKTAMAVVSREEILPPEHSTLNMGGRRDADDLPAWPGRGCRIVWTH